MPTTNVKTYNDSAVRTFPVRYQPWTEPTDQYQATVASVCEDVSKVPDGKLAIDQLYRLLEAINK